jgi:hypothetical protein
VNPDGTVIDAAKIRNAGESGEGDHAATRLAR